MLSETVGGPFRLLTNQKLGGLLFANGLTDSENEMHEWLAQTVTTTVTELGRRWCEILFKKC